MHQYKETCVCVCVCVSVCLCVCVSVCLCMCVCVYSNCEHFARWCVTGETCSLQVAFALSSKFSKFFSLDTLV
jgi:hypothetical protein